MDVSGKQLFEAMIDAVIVVDLEGTVVEVNTAATTLSGFAAPELIGMAVAKLFVDELSGIRTRVRQQIADGASLRREESWLITKSGERLPVSITGSPILDGLAVTAIVVVARDAREIRQLLMERNAELARRQQAELQLRDALVTIEHKLELMRRQLLLAERRATLGALAGGVGHELRNIAQVQAGSLDVLQQAIATGADLAAPVQAILRELERVSDHVMLHANHLMRLAKPDRDQIQSLHVDEVVGDVVTMLRGSGKLRGIALETSDGTMGYVVRANRARLEQVLVNLTVNAAEAITAPGRIAIHSTADVDAGKIVIEVRDTGIGMTPEVFERMFDPFFTTKGDEHGTGLGLGIVRDIIEGYGGTLVVESKPREGTTVRFDLPMAE